MQHHVFQMGIRAFQEYFKGFVMLFVLCQIFVFVQHIWLWGGVFSAL